MSYDLEWKGVHRISGKGTITPHAIQGQLSVFAIKG